MTAAILPPGRVTLQQALNAVLRQDLASFIRKSATTLAPGVPFEDNWHIQAIAWHLNEVREGRMRRLIINLPPRSLKSISASVAFPAYVLGHDPSRRIICVSYANDLSAKHSSDYRVIVTSAWYRRAFTRMRVARATESEVTTAAHGSRLATSVGGTLTGRGGDIIVIDDPLKPVDALSESKRETANQWFVNTLLSRLDDKRTGAIVVVMQRVHMDDLTGFLTSQSDDWAILNLPAIAEADEVVRIGDERWHQRRLGEALHPEREPLHVLERMRQELGSDLFAAQYQQSPVPPGGALIKRAWVRRYTALPPRSASRVFQSWDTASKDGPQNDWSACTTWFVYENRYYLVDVLRGRFDYPTLRARAIDHAQAHRPDKVLIEDAGVGTALLPELRRAGYSAVPVRPDRDKVTRMSIASAKFEAGLPLLPERAAWLPELEAELFSFPQSRHDDQVDSISQALGHEAYSYDTSMGWVC